MPGTRAHWFSVLVACSILAACSKADKTTQVPDAGLIPPGVGYGGACKSGGDCRADLVCDPASKLCMPGGNVLQGGSCFLSGSCVLGNYCNQQGTCKASGTQPAGGTCTSEGDCAAGLTCAVSGLGGVCQTPGAGDLTRSCLSTAECLAGLLCVRGQCTKGYMSSPKGPVCNLSEEPTPKVYFHVPRASDLPSTDFYRLPFPNDIRMTNGLVSLAGHPLPGATILPFDLVERYKTAIEAEAKGFGANQAAYFRFSRQIDLNRFPGQCPATLVDINPSSPEYGSRKGIVCGAYNGSASFICGPYMWVRPALGDPLLPKNKYALLVTRDPDPLYSLVDSLGAPFGPDADFTAMLAATPPEDAELGAAYSAYDDLRKYIAAGKATADNLLAAAVFTVEDYEAPMNGVAAAVAAAPAPVVERLVRCGDASAVSPCEDGKAGAEHVRGCLPADQTNPAFTTYQGTLALPVFQTGTPPYLQPSDGGKIEYGAGGVATVQRSEKVCFSLTVPAGTPPATGWPLIVYGHGTGGSYRSIVDLGLATDFAVGAAPVGLGVGVDGGASAVPVPIAMLGFDGVMHGPRAGGSTKSTGELVYNFLNPAAARDNALQAAADLLAIPRSLASFASQGIVLDGKRLSLYGHSQGGNAASLVAARESPYGTIVMSGTGGTLIYTLLGKTQPVNIPAVLPYILGEIGAAAVDHGHPVLNLMQMYFERSDSVNFGRRLFKQPVDGMTPHHLLHVYGMADTYSVNATQQAYALAAQLKAAPPLLDPYGIDAITTAPPYSYNEFFGRSGKLTALQLQYDTDKTYDGHFVSTSNPRARAAIAQMLVTAARDGIPTVTP